MTRLRGRLNGFALTVLLVLLVAAAIKLVGGAVASRPAAALGAARLAR